MDYGFQKSDLKRGDALSTYIASAESGGLKSVRVGNDKWLTKRIAEEPARTNEFVNLTKMVTDAIDDRLTGGLTFTRVSSDPFAAANLDIASYYERRGGGTWIFRVQDLFAAMDAYYGPGQIAANTPVG